ncbi:21869_t:CDS:2, partial [Gigaspora margarita]
MCKRVGSGNWQGARGGALIGIPGWTGGNYYDNLEKVLAVQVVFEDVTVMEHLTLQRSVRHLELANVKPITSSPNIFRVKCKLLSWFSITKNQTEMVRYKRHIEKFLMLSDLKSANLLFRSKTVRMGRKRSVRFAERRDRISGYSHYSETLGG